MLTVENDPGACRPKALTVNDGLHGPRTNVLTANDNSAKYRVTTIL